MLSRNLDTAQHQAKFANPTVVQALSTSPRSLIPLRAQALLHAASALPPTPLQLGFAARDMLKTPSRTSIANQPRAAVFFSADWMKVQALL